MAVGDNSKDPIKGWILSPSTKFIIWNSSPWYLRILPYLEIDSLRPARLLCPWNSPGKNTGDGCHSLLQEIFLTQGLNPHLLYGQMDSLSLSHLGSPRVIAAAAKSFQSCPILCDPIDGSPPGSPVPGILQARTVSGLPFPSPVHENESEVTQSCPTLSDSVDCSPPGSSIHGIFQARGLEWGAIAFSESHCRCD